MTAQQQLVIDYFDQTHDDYRFLWGIDRHFGLHCGFFDNEHRRHDDAVLNMNYVLSRAAGISMHDRILDAGCGIGGSAVWLAENVGAAVVGININTNQIHQARCLARRCGLTDQVQFLVANFSATGLPGASFDVVWALESVCYAEDKRSFLMEAHRVLKPGGRLVVADGFLIREALAPDERRIVECWRQGWAIPNLTSIDQFKRWTREAGFRRCNFQDITQHVVPSSRRIYLASLMFYPLGLLLHWLRLRTVLQTRGIASGYYQYQARRRGLGIYGIFVAER
jgi:tocopherol O-methyltransferase